MLFTVLCCSLCSSLSLNYFQENYYFSYNTFSTSPQDEQSYKILFLFAYFPHLFPLAYLSFSFFPSKRRQEKLPLKTFLFNRLVYTYAVSCTSIYILTNFTTASNGPPTVELNKPINLMFCYYTSWQLIPYPGEPYIRKCLLCKHTVQDAHLVYQKVTIDYH